NSQAYPAGNTPLLAPQRLRNKHGLPNLFLKNDSLNPSGSLKDRASMLVAEQAKLAGAGSVVLASTGNAGSAMACAGAAYGLDVILFVPAAAPKAKLIQSILYGAKVVPIQGSYDRAFTLSIEYTEAFGGVNRNTAYNPFTVEGKKTAAIEIYNQLGGAAPDIVYVPTGDGAIYSGVWKGFADLLMAGAIEIMPKLVMVQAKGSNALFRSFRDGVETLLTDTNTYADSIAVKSPAAGELALRAVKETGGTVIEVSDQEIQTAQRELCSEAGVFVEPSSAAGWAGCVKNAKSVEASLKITVLLTGSGFKDIEAAERLTSLPESCPPDLDSASSYLERMYRVSPPA
ncbi:MAG: pyridoxal-phosphate dependent enzyme, partial [Spirochaetales bacterium]|nr:pyridoxal-phosphate dependent enzyme [Spirochaetales bacterium]